MSVAERERFFYHSFPRRGSNTDAEIDKGCKILSLICDAGLLLSPEVVRWQYSHADGSPPRTQTYIQRRACFTELGPSDLSEHAEMFGHFALEFEIDVLKGMGALPVFYIPQATSTNSSEINDLGSVLVNQIIDAAVLAMRFTQVKTLVDSAPEGARLDTTMGVNKFKAFSLDAKETRNTLEALGYGLTPPDMLEQSLYDLLHCFYPADNLRDNKALAYYRQREWRISHNFAVRGEEVMHRVSDEVIGRLMEIDAQFFGRDFPIGLGMSRLAKESWIYPGFGGKRVIEMVRRVIVPREALERAIAIVAKVATNVPVVCIDNLKQPNA
jgi:Putative abortive phage resistance protein AbiGi, antitoxin